jgi:hypothetical protein
VSSGDEGVVVVVEGVEAHGDDDDGERRIY